MTGPEHLDERLTALVDGELGPEERDRALAHLATCAQCREEADTLRRLRDRLRGLGSGRRSDTAEDAGGGERIGRYRVLRLLGRGGMGDVHLCAAPTGRRVAVRTLRPMAVEGAPIRERMAREIAALSRVSGSHVARIIDADMTAEPPYIVTAYVPGRALDEVVEESGPLQGEGLRRLATGLAEALSEIHRAGLAHRDLKPSNVLLVDGEPVVIDFGVPTNRSSLTAVGPVLESPYMSPETIGGEKAGPPSDVHAWAATVAYAATGRPPFGSGTFESIFYKIIWDAPDLDGVPDPLLPLLRAAMEKSPSGRPATEDLVRQVRDLRLGTESSWSADRASLWAPSPPPSPTPFLAAARLSWIAWQWATGVRSYAERLRRGRRERRIRRQNAKALRLVGKGRYGAAVTLLEKALEFLPERHPQAAVARNNLGVALRGLGRLSDAERALRAADAARASMTGIPAAQTRISANLHAVRQERGGQDGRAETGDLRADLIAAESATGGAPSTSGISIRGNLAVALRDAGRLEEAEAEAEAAAQSARRSLGRDDPRTLALQANLAAIQRDRGEPAKAEALLRETSDRARRVLGRDHPQALVARASLAAVLADLGRPDAAAALLREVREARERTLGPAHPATLRAGNSLGFLYLDGGETDKAEELFNGVLAAKDAAPDDVREIMARAHRGLARVRGDEA